MNWRSHSILADVGVFTNISLSPLCRWSKDQQRQPNLCVPMYLCVYVVKNELEESFHFSRCWCFHQHLAFAPLSLVKRPTTATKPMCSYVPMCLCGEK